MLGAQPAIVRCTTAPTGAASGQTVIDPPAGRPGTFPAGADAQPAAAGAAVGVAATEAVAAGVAADAGAAEAGAAEAADDDKAAGALAWAVAVWVAAAGDDAAELGVTGALEAHPASTAVRAQAAPRAAAGRSRGRDLVRGIVRPPCREKL
jgi:hypothetical protein